MTCSERPGRGAGGAGGTPGAGLPVPAGTAEPRRWDIVVVRIQCHLAVVPRRGVAQARNRAFPVRRLCPGGASRRREIGHSRSANGCSRAPRDPQTGHRSHRHHQRYGPGCAAPAERHETPVPARSNALEARFHSVVPGLRRVAGGGCGTDAPAEVPAGIGRPAAHQPACRTSLQRATPVINRLPGLRHGSAT